MTQVREIGPDAVIVQQGRLLDFIDGLTQRLETPEEYVRQEIAKSLVREYGYERSQVAVEFMLRVGSNKPRSDLVIFDQGDSHVQENARLIVECKSEKIKSTDRKDGIGQLQSYMAVCPNVAYGMWTNGLERLCFRRIEADGKVSFHEVLDIPSRGHHEDVERPKFEQLKSASSDVLLFAFRRCHNYIAGNQGLQKPEAFWELLKIIFCKIHDERSSDEVQFYATSKERDGLNGRLKVKQRTDDLFDKVKSAYPTIFKANEVIELEPAVLTYIVGQLQLYSLLMSDTDVKGRAYEEIVGSNLRGDRGEFFTPRNICQMAVAMLDPDERQVILDPACGTGGFLITAMNHVVEKIRQAEVAKWGDIERGEAASHSRIDSYARSHIIGIDLNPNLVKAAKMNMVMNNDGAGGLYQANTLKATATWNDELRNRRLQDSVDIIFTNPPFGSKIQIDDPSILERYDLGHIWTYDDELDRWSQTGALHRSQPPEILFIERCVKFLKPGSGRAAMVLPDGILGSPGLGYVREWLLKNTQILASIDLHPDTFQPNVHIQTSVLVVQRKTEQTIALEAAARQYSNYSVFMAIADHVGHDKRGNQTYVRARDGSEIFEEVEDKVVEYVDGRKVHKTHRTKRKVRDDNTMQIAQAFREWLSEHA